MEFLHSHAFGSSNFLHLVSSTAYTQISSLTVFVTLSQTIQGIIAICHCQLYKQCNSDGKVYVIAWFDLAYFWDITATAKTGATVAELYTLASHL